MKNIIKHVIGFFLSLIPKNKKKVMAYVDCNKTDQGLFPYHDDSVYLICERLKERYPDLQVCYFFNKIQEHDPENARKYLFKQFLYNLTTYYVITSVFPFHFYHTKNQKIVCTGYYTPFKADRFIENYTNVKYRPNYNESYHKMCSYFDHFPYSYLVTSKYSLNIISASMGIPASKFKVLGLARNELLLEEKTFDLKKIFSLNYTPRKVLLYVPTFRDYDFNKLDPYLEDKNIFGYKTCDKLKETLKKHDILLLYKPHNQINFAKGSDIYNENIKLVTRAIMEEYQLGSYGLMRMADVMICDYSSISFDYLQLDRPLIYNIYDYDLYDQYRGFPIQSMKIMMPGEKVTTEDELVLAIEHVIQGVDPYKKERAIINAIVNEVPLEGTIDRIIDHWIE